MHCTNCGKQVNTNEKFCTGCGKPLSHKSKSSNFKFRGRPLNIPGLVVILIIIVLVIYGAYASSQDDTARQSNDQGLSSMNNGNTQLATQQLQSASQTASDDNIKRATLINLAYVYESDNKDLQALTTFKQALQLAQSNTSDYYLILAEIADLQGDQYSAYTNFNNADQINPNNYQITNSLGLFYLDLDNTSTNYENYPKALILLKKAYSIAPVVNGEIAKQNLAIAYCLNDNYAQTISLLLNENFNNFPYSAYWLGLAYLGEGDSINGRFYLQKAVNLGANVPQKIKDFLNSN